MNYIGTDSHISTLDFKVVDGDLGKVKNSSESSTSAPNFLEFVKSVPYAAPGDHRRRTPGCLVIGDLRPQWRKSGDLRIPSETNGSVHRRKR